MNNKTIGKEFENKLCEYFSKQGYWAHFLTPAPDGSQPFDIIAIKGNCVLAIDAKTLEKERFPLSRVEDNQELSFEKLNRVGMRNTYFAIKISDTQFTLIPSIVLTKMKQEGKKSVNIKELLPTYGVGIIE